MSDIIDNYYMNIAKAVSERSPCLRAKYGCVIVKDDRIVSVGYNAPATGEPHCIICSRKHTAHGHSYGEDCPSVHAEENAIINSGRDRCIGGILYLWGTNKSEPCYRCSRLIKNVGIERCYITNIGDIK